MMGFATSDALAPALHTNGAAAAGEPTAPYSDVHQSGTKVRLRRAFCPAATDERQPMKKQKIKFSEQQALDTCVRQLEALLEGLKAGTLSLSQGGEKLWLRPGGAVDIELSAEQSGERESLEIRLEWQRASLHVDARRPEDAPPKTVRNWHMTPAARDLARDVAADDVTSAS